MPFVAPATRNAPLAPAARRLSRKTFSLIPLITPGARATPSLTSPLTTLKTREPPTPSPPLLSLAIPFSTVFIAEENGNTRTR